MKQSETSDKRAYLTTLNISSFNTHLLQENFDDDENVIHHQPTTPQQPSQITQDTTESLQDTLINPPNTSTVTDSNARQVSIHDITENTNNLFNQEDPSTLFTMNTIDTQPLQTHQMIQQNYDPPHPPSKTSTLSTPQTSPQQVSSNTFQIREHTSTESQFQTTTPPRQSSQTIQYIPAQSSISQNTKSVLIINTLLSNPITNATTSRTCQDLLYHLFKITHFRTTLLVPIFIPHHLQTLLNILIFNHLPLNLTLTSLLPQHKQGQMVN